MLEATGLIHVSGVYLGGYHFSNLTVTLKDGMVTGYDCDNFENPDEISVTLKKQYLKLMTALPLGEFAIGTNTTAYVMARKYNIVEKLPILIVEKMGPPLCSWGHMLQPQRRP